jgi:hypothetical protein
MKLAVALFSVLCIASVGCEAEEAKSYATYQACFDEQTMKGDKLPVQEAIVKCCIDHPIGGMTLVCGATKPDCINYLTANLAQTSASTIDKMDACDTYISEKPTM